jgi:hypothetical protein
VTIRQLRVMRSGERTNAAGKPVSNRILLTIPDGEYRSIRPHLEYLRMPSHRSLHEPHQKLAFVHFLNQGLISLVVVMEDGRTVEAGIVGNEGASGIAAAVGLKRGPLREIVQIAGDGFRVRVVDSRTPQHSGPLHYDTGNASCANSRMQSAAPHRAASCTMVAHCSGSSGFGIFAHHARFPCDNARNGPA